MARITHHNFLRFASDVWEKFQTYSPKRWFFMVMNPMGSSPSKKNQLNKHILAGWRSPTTSQKSCFHHPQKRSQLESPGPLVIFYPLDPSIPANLASTSELSHHVTAESCFQRLFGGMASKPRSLVTTFSWKQKWLDGDPLKHQGNLTS